MYKELDSFICKNGKISAMECTPSDPRAKKQYIVMVENYSMGTAFVAKYATAAELFDQWHTFVQYTNPAKFYRGESVLLKHRGANRFADAPFTTPALELVASPLAKFSVYVSKPVSACCRRGAQYVTDSYAQALAIYKHKEKELWPNVQKTK